MILFSRQRKIINEGMFPNFFFIYTLQSLFHLDKIIYIPTPPPPNHLGVKTHITRERFKLKALGRDAFCLPHSSWPHLVVLVVLHSWRCKPVGRRWRSRGCKKEERSKRARKWKKEEWSKSLFPQCTHLLLPKFECLTLHSKYKSILVHIYIHTYMHIFKNIYRHTHTRRTAISFIPSLCSHQ